MHATFSYHGCARHPEWRELMIPFLHLGFTREFGVDKSPQLEPHVLLIAHRTITSCIWKTGQIR
jgi:hypothetical protein